MYPERMPTTEEVTKSIQKAGRRAMREHALLGRSLPRVVDGKVTYITPREVIAMLKDFEVEDNQVIPEYAPFIHGPQPTKPGEPNGEFRSPEYQ